MTEGQYESGDKREREKVAAKRGVRNEKVGRRRGRVGKRAERKMKRSDRDKNTDQINKTKQIIVNRDLREHLKALEIKGFTQCRTFLVFKSTNT